MVKTTDLRHKRGLGFSGAGCGYNAARIDPGTTVMLVNGEPRSSLITDPAHGRLPPNKTAVTVAERAQATFRQLHILEVFAAVYILFHSCRTGDAGERGGPNATESHPASPRNQPWCTAGCRARAAGKTLTLLTEPAGLRRGREIRNRRP
jgi:hypothetical protein